MATQPQSGTNAVSSPRIVAQGANTHYVNQRAPLTPSPFQKLPVGAVRAGGWLGTQMKLQAEGYSGRLPEISEFLNLENNAWIDPQLGGRAGWEELPYWLRGQISLAYQIDDKAMIAEVERLAKASIASQQEDGWFGPESNRQHRLGTPDLWPNMLMLTVLQTYHEATGDPAVITLMTKYAGWLAAQSDEVIVNPDHYWHYYRVGDQIANLVWLYNRTGDRKLIDLAKRLHDRSGKWEDGPVNVHGVNLAQGFREPAFHALFTGDKAGWDATDRTINAFRDKWGQMPGGMYGADENARENYTDPRQATESCSVTEMMYSYELLLEVSGDPRWADETEDVTLNWMPVTMTDDLCGLRYLQGANMTLGDAAAKNPGIQNGGPMFLYDARDHRCCQHNIGMGWPFYVERHWFATNGNGLAATLHSPSTVTAKVGATGEEVTVTQSAEYPFEETLKYTFATKKAVKFPFAVRIPAWSGEATVTLNGESLSVKGKPGEYVQIDRTWADGDVLTVNLPMSVREVTWSQRPGTKSIYHGPLAYSLQIEEEEKVLDPEDRWSEIELHPGSDWNYGLVDGSMYKVERTPMPEGQPWTFNDVPVTITAQGRKIPEWTLDMFGLTAVLQQSPAFTTAPVEEITLIPMGAARLRISVFPTVTDDAEAGTVWEKPRQARTPIPTTYSYKHYWENEGAASDGIIPDHSGDDTVPRVTFWNHKGTTEWLQYTFPATRTFQSTRVYWFDDGSNGQCRVPESWKIQVKVGDEWRDVEVNGAYPVVKDGWSRVTFRPIGGTEIRLVVKLQPEWSGGVLEWEIE